MPQSTLAALQSTVEVRFMKHSLVKCLLFSSLCIVTALPAQVFQRSRSLRELTTTAHTPARGSSERKAIAEAMRRDVGKFSGRYVVFNFQHLKVNRAWAYAVTRPESPDGKTKLEPVSALLRKSKGQWSVAGRLLGAEAVEKVAERRLRAKFPQAPSNIFPR